MNCLFCQQELQTLCTRYDFMDFEAGHDYRCPPCNTRFIAGWRTKINYIDGSRQEWEEIDYYSIRQEDYEIECYFYPTPSCYIKRYLPNDRVNIILRFNFIPPNLTPQNLLQRAKLWTLFS